MSTKKIKLLKEIQETLKGKHLSHSRKFKSKLKEKQRTEHFYVYSDAIIGFLLCT